MKKLRHSITIEGFSYTRHSTLNELSHEIVMSTLLVQHKELNEFNVSNFRLTYSLTNNQNQLTMIIEDISMNQNK